MKSQKQLQKEWDEKVKKQRAQELKDEEEQFNDGFNRAFDHWQDSIYCTDQN